MDESFNAEHLHVKPGKGAAFVRTKLKNAVTNNTVDKTFRAGESVASATVEKKEYQYTYADGNDVSLGWQSARMQIDRSAMQPKFLLHIMEHMAQHTCWKFKHLHK